VLRDKPRFKLKLIIALITLLSLTLSSCFQNRSSGKRKASGVVNTSSSVSLYHGRVLHSNPIILSGNSDLSPYTDLNTLLVPAQDYITSESNLIGFCTNITDVNSPCYKVLEDNLASPLTSSDLKWAYLAGTSEFDQVHTFFHIKKIVERFHSVMDAYHSGLHYYNNIQITPPYDTSFPFTYHSQNGHWNGGGTLTAYSKADVSDNAYYQQSDNSLHFGFLADYPNIKMVHDPSIIYHETGHALVKIMMNIRNNAYGTNTAPITKSALGGLQYDEGGAINEGIADFFSYAINERPHLGEWALGNIDGGFSRPMTESDSLHTVSLGTDNSSRLSYPTYLTYDPNFKGEVIQDIHNAGMITSHFLVALTDDLISKCSISSKATAINYVLTILSETLAEMGDLTATGNNNTSFSVNLNYNHSDDWIKINNPANYHTFYQTFAKHALNVVGNGRCNNRTYSQGDLETLLDSYGLLLFENYNQDGNSATDGHLGTNTTINLANKIRTVSVSKDMISLDPTENATTAYLFDKRANMKTALEELMSSGQVASITPHIASDLPYNNGNGKISPGEIIGLAINLYNNSNTEIGGVQILANDWDHFKNDRPCNTFEDNFPSINENGADSTSEANPSSTPGDCNYITRDNGDESDEELYPVCFAELSDTDGTKWVSQEDLRESIGLEKQYCLSGDTTKTKDCYVRAIKGADQSYYARIKPNSPWDPSLNSDGTPSFNYSNIIFFEINKRVPPETTFNCRLRVRFSNCTDCFSDITRSDSDNYLDYEFSGAAPFKIINFQFTVKD
jgi:hypothetical protein